MDPYLVTMLLACTCLQLLLPMTDGKLAAPCARLGTILLQTLLLSHALYELLLALVICKTHVEVTQHAGAMLRIISIWSPCRLETVSSDARLHTQLSKWC